MTQQHEQSGAPTAGLEMLINNDVAEVVYFRKKNFKIGRAPEADIQLLDGEISGLHCRFEWVQKGFQVFDCNSTNGTFVNEQKVLKSKLKPGDKIRIGKSVFRYFEAKASPPFILEAAFEAEALTGFALKEKNKIMALLENRRSELFKNQRLQFLGSWSDGTKSELKIDSRSEILGRASDLGHFALDADLSRQHLKVSLEDNGDCYVEDLGSLNGSFVNDEKVASKLKIESHDLVRIGNTEFRVMVWAKKR